MISIGVTPLSMIVPEALKMSSVVTVNVGMNEVSETDSGMTKVMVLSSASMAPTMSESREGFKLEVSLMD